LAICRVLPKIAVVVDFVVIVIFVVIDQLAAAAADNPRSKTT
jgi:hypothetical protein